MNYDTLPQNLKDVLERYEICEDYIIAQEIKQELQFLGYFVEFDLSAEIEIFQVGDTVQVSETENFKPFTGIISEFDFSTNEFIVLDTSRDIFITIPSVKVSHIEE